MSKSLMPIMVVGTGSDVGKSIIATAFCRILLQDGYSPAPFKAQNMALNSFVTKEGLEIGRAQAAQAEAAGIDPVADMNPILLKPNTDRNSQVILNGKVFGNREAYQYFKKEGREFFRQEVAQAFDRLSKQYNPIILEGAGSISELNLREVDIVNMPMAERAKAAVILVADIDRGGVFASLYGSIMLLPQNERKLIKGIIINKFRGDIALFKSGIEIIENLCKVPVLGVLPYFKDIKIEEEDSVSLELKTNKSQSGKINVAVILLRHISNFTDFTALERYSSVNLYYSNNIEEIAKADIILIPGTKSTIQDLIEIRKNGVYQQILKSHKEGTSVIGICGGLQIMGEIISDPQRIEGEIEEMHGLGLLPIETVIAEEKRTVQVKFRPIFAKTESSYDCTGYEIHMGRTHPRKGSDIGPLNTLSNGENEGYYKNEKCMGSYIHGILDNKSFTDFILSPYSQKEENQPDDYAQFKELQYNKLADLVREHINMDQIYKIIGR